MSRSATNLLLMVWLLVGPAASMNAKAGGHSNFFDFAFWRGTGHTSSDGRPSQPPPEEILEGGQYLVEFVERAGIPFWTMEPHDELAEIIPVAQTSNRHDGPDVFTLARPGEEYVCYLLGDGPATVAVELPEGLFTVRWYNPKTGRFLGSKAPTGGGRQRLSSPDFRQDIVLHLRATKVEPR